ncbi:MAG: tRNA guanosine(34) transglycosylase Tgt [Patescibacteria group bacterium]
MLNQAFTLAHTHESGIRRGVLQLGHGPVETPAFMPIATVGAVKALTMQQVAALKPSIILANTYHLSLRPGLEVISAAGGLHRFMGWDKNLLTDSGGFQIFSLAKLVERDLDGVSFRSHIDGSLVRMTPERSMEVQTVLNPDIAMSFDWFPGFPAKESEVEESVKHTSAWASRSKQAFRGDGLLFGIVQGGMFPEWRERSAAELSAMDFPGYAVGGLAVGESFTERERILQTTTPFLPQHKPRYAMGVGLPEDILSAVRAGIDLFDCVIPTREGRHGKIYTGGMLNDDLTRVEYHTINISSSAYRLDMSPLDPKCECSVCTTGVTRAYTRHLFTIDEPAAFTITSVHNLYFYLSLMQRIRDRTEQAH